MRLELKGGGLVVTRNKDDEYEMYESDDERELLDDICDILNEPLSRGKGLVQMNMGQDGHLVDETQTYLRPEGGESHIHIFVWYGNYQIDNAAEVLMEMGQVTYNLEFDVFNEGQDSRERLQRLLWTLYGGPDERCE